MLAAGAMRLPAGALEAPAVLAAYSGETPASCAPAATVAPTAFAVSPPKAVC